MCNEINKFSVRYLQWKEILQTSQRTVTLPVLQGVERVGQDSRTCGDPVPWQAGAPGNGENGCEYYPKSKITRTNVNDQKLKYLFRHVQVPTSAGGVVSIIMPRLLFMEWR